MLNIADDKLNVRPCLTPVSFSNMSTILKMHKAYFSSRYTVAFARQRSDQNEILTVILIPHN